VPGRGINVNLYTDPQEDVNVGIRDIPAGGAANSAAGDYMQELIKDPPQFKIGFLSNNPPVYDLLPKAREAFERWRLGNRPEAGH
jgi:arylsulfatase